MFGAGAVAAGIALMISPIPNWQAALCFWMCLIPLGLLMFLWTVFRTNYTIRKINYMLQSNFGDDFTVDSEFSSPSNRVWGIIRFVVFRVLLNMVHLVFIVLLILQAIQAFDDSVHTPSHITGERYIIMYEGDAELKMRGYCAGETKRGDPYFLIESGLGHDGSSLFNLQSELAKDYYVCTYDRVGLGESWNGNSIDTLS